MFNKKTKQIKDLQCKVAELENYVEKKKDEEWVLQHPEGEFREIPNGLVWYYSRNNSVLLLHDVKYSRLIGRVNKMTTREKIVEIEVEWENPWDIISNSGNLSKFIIDTSTRNCIEKSRVEINYCN